MKSILPILFVFFISSAQAQFEMGLHYSLSAPVGILGENIQPVHNFDMMGYGRLGADRKLYVGGEIAFGTYAHKSMEQTFISEDGEATITDVDYSSNIYNYHAIVGYDFTRATSIVPYVTVKAGMSQFNTMVVIQDPDEHHSCHPLDEDNLFCDVAFSAGMGAGLKMDVSSVFTNWRKGICWLDLSANYLYGTSLDYVNVKYMTTDEKAPNRPSKEFNVKFIDMDTEMIHEHQVAQVYTSAINMVDFKIGIVKTFGWCH